jgi:hypothetical protein
MGASGARVGPGAAPETAEGEKAKIVLIFAGRAIRPNGVRE